MIKRIKTKKFAELSRKVDIATAEIVGDKVKKELLKMQNDIVRHKIKKITEQYLKGEINFRDFKGKIEDQTSLKVHGCLPVPKLDYEENPETKEVFFVVDIDTTKCKIKFE